MIESLPLVHDAARNLTRCAGEPLVFHCHHYNTFLQRTITDASEVPRTLLQDAASAVVRAQLLSWLWEHRAANPRHRLALAESFHRLQGFGALDLSRCEAWGGRASVQHSHYGDGFLGKFGPQTEPVCYFSAGAIAAALEVAYARPAGSYLVTEQECVACGAPACRFVVTPRDPEPGYTSPGIGVLSEAPPPPRHAVTPIDEEAIIRAVGGLPLEGNEEGSIPAFGVYLTRHYTNYLNLISYEFERLLQASRGAIGAEVAATMLTEAGHVCIFNTAGGIMCSPEWYGLVVPAIKSREDWMHGIVAVFNALGFGRWQVQELQPGERLVLRIYDGYESNGYLAQYGTSEAPKCYLATGGAAGLMNLLYHGDITQRPALSDTYYRELFRSPRSFEAAETQCRAKGDPYCEFLALRRDD